MSDGHKKPGRVTSIRLTDEDKRRIHRLTIKGWGRNRTEIVREALRHLDKAAS